MVRRAGYTVNNAGVSIEARRPRIEPQAQAMQPAAAPGRHLWLRANHPSPLSALRPPQPFIGCGHFRAANGFLTAAGGPAIDWLGEALADLPHRVN